MRAVPQLDATTADSGTWNLDTRLGTLGTGLGTLGTGLGNLVIGLEAFGDRTGNPCHKTGEPGDR